MARYSLPAEPKSSAQKPRLPRLRRSGFRAGWQVRGDAVLETGDPIFSTEVAAGRATNTGLTEGELISALNYLDKEALCAFEGIGEKTAESILLLRTKVQYFSSVDELTQVPRVGRGRFRKLVGREPEMRSYRLHDLMRRNRRDNVLWSDLRPWIQPAPGIHEIYLAEGDEIALQNRRGEDEFRQVKTERIGRFRLFIFHQEGLVTGRGRYLFANLPRILRSIIHERNIATAD